MSNPMVEAWMEAARDLNISVVHPFTFTGENGKTYTTQGVYLPDFGGTKGTVLSNRFDSDEVSEASWECRPYYSSSLNPHSYEPYS